MPSFRKIASVDFELYPEEHKDGQTYVKAEYIDLISILPGTKNNTKI